MDLRTGMAVLETLARADGSTGWTVMIGAETPHLLALLSRDRFDKIYAAGPDVVVAGAFAPQGRAPGLPVTMHGHRTRVIVGVPGSLVGV
ncbi:hypothetical protein [Micromonospora sp. ATA51]|uniref:hypothetical protein n=1 Tax=Micromonospora sp. ATA51 TaxID=2806098 RepID=UPI001A38A37A|nr:hypothetical protein [Micromonospora sp. ATA51]MBM0224759.1 hypothetical protein [Micromonospora sp. ATA51]